MSYILIFLLALLWKLAIGYGPDMVCVCVFACACMCVCVCVGGCVENHSTLTTPWQAHLEGFLPSAILSYVISLEALCRKSATITQLNSNCNL